MKFDNISDRPDSNISMEMLDYVIEAVSIMIVLGTFIFTAVAWRSLPESIPTSFDFFGNVEKYGSKSTVFFILPVMVLLCGGFILLSRFPRTYSYLVEITKENAQVQYKLGVRFMRILGLEMTVMFLMIQIMIFTGALYGKLEFFPYFIPVIMVGIFGTVVWYFITSKRKG